MDETKYSNSKTVKESHPIQRANIISRLLFCWLLPFFVKGLKTELNEDHMYAVQKVHESGRLGDRLEIAWSKKVAKKKGSSLLVVLFSVFKWELGIYAIFNVLFELSRVAQPFLISKLLSYYEPGATDKNKDDAYLYGCLIILAAFSSVLLAHNYQLQLLALGMKMRVAVCSMIYRKALKLSKSALAETTVGQMVNLLSNDVGRFDSAAHHIHYLWIAPAESCLIAWLLYTSVGPTGLAGTLFLLCFLPLQMYMGELTSRYRLKTAICTDERVRLMNEIISGIQVIKMYTWERPFAKLVELSRKKEIQQIRATSTIRALIMSFNMVLNRIAIFLCILVYILTGNTISAGYAYTVTSYYNVLKNAVIMAFPVAITQFAETKVSVKRVQKFLKLEEIKLNEDTSDKQITNVQNGLKTNLLKDKNVGIHMVNVSIKWLNSLPENNLENINFDVNSNQLVAVVGPVGGGKTTLLHAILKELPPLEGNIVVQGKISYSSQEPWVFGGSVKQNILFGQEYDPIKYKEVIGVCALERDFKLFPNGDKTLVGERGVTLSGGQRARVNLARAVYKNADIYLLDDPLSAVDTHVGKQLFDDCICGYLRNKCVVLVTHQLQYLRNVHCIYLLEEGKVMASGTYQQMQVSNTEFTKLLAQCENEDKKAEEKTRLKPIIKDKESKGNNKELPKQEREQRASGIVTLHVYKSYFRAGGNWCQNGFIFGAFILSQIFASCTDYFVTIWVNLNQWKSENMLDSVRNTNNINGSMHNTTEPLGELHKRWMEPILDKDRAIIIYSCILGLTVIITVSRSLRFFKYCMTASSNLHHAMFNKIVFSTMRFFNTNPTGRILNRFSKDIGGVDEALPIALVDTIQVGLIVSATSLVIGSLNPWILISTFMIATIFYFLRKMFLASSRNIKRVEAATRSPIYTHLSASLQGLTTIRAFGAQEILSKEFDRFQDYYTEAYYLFLCANRTFGFWLDLHCVIYTGMVIISILFIENEAFGGNVGLALTQSITLTGMFQWGMRQWSELENQMTSVERVQEYADLVPESNTNSKQPPKVWSEKGVLKFQDLSLKYSPDDPYVLKDLNFGIESRAKIGIVGRTGAGKSSLIQALFRLTKIEGHIYIDNVDTKTLPLNILRSNISIIPQEPVLFSGSLRNNLDPFDEYNDEILWNALEQVELKNAVDDLPGGLDCKMAEGGSNFSVGQRQLVCLARAIIRRNKILVLDEATANVDPQTDALIQSTIRHKFADCTVLTIAHRLHTIMDSDKVLVMDAGKAVEFDHPHVLLQDKNGLFSKMVSQTGAVMADNLRMVAAENFKNT